MHKRFTRRHFLICSTLSVIGTSSPGCGTILHDERIGQPRGGIEDIDWTIAGMNAIGLVFFFVPGVIAFAIDYYNGSLFYPPQYYSEINSKQLNSIRLPDEEISVAKIEELIASELGKEVSLLKPDVVSKELSSISSFWTTYDEVVSNV